VPESLSCAFYREHGKERIFHVSARKHTANNKHTANRVLRRVPSAITRRTPIFAVCHMSGTRRTLFCRHAPSRALTDVIICRVSRVTHGKHGPLPCACKDCVCRVPQSSTRRTQKKFMFLLPNFFYTLHILFGTLCLNMIFL